MHPEAFAFVAHVARDHEAKGPVYEIGSRNINGTVRGLFRDAPLYIGVDVIAGPDVDLVADAATYVPPVQPETVVCCEVLEHTEQAETIVKQASKVLAPGGLLIVTCAGEGRAPHSAVDGGPIRNGEFYRNLSLEELERWTVESGVESLSPPQSHPGDLHFVGRKR